MTTPSREDIANLIQDSFLSPPSPNEIADVILHKYFLVERREDVLLDLDDRLVRFGTVSKDLYVRPKKDVERQEQDVQAALTILEAEKALSRHQRRAEIDRLAMVLTSTNEASHAENVRIAKELIDLGVYVPVTVTAATPKD